MPQSPTLVLVRSPNLAFTPYAHAATVEGAQRLVFSAGACPLGKDGAVVAPGDVGAQAERALDNLVVALKECGAGLQDVVKTTIFVASDRREDLVAVWTVVCAGFGEHEPPSTLLGVSVLGYSDQLVEIEAVAVVPSG